MRRAYAGLGAFGASDLQQHSSLQQPPFHVRPFLSVIAAQGHLDFLAAQFNAPEQHHPKINVSCAITHPHEQPTAAGLSSFSEPSHKMEPPPPPDHHFIPVPAEAPLRFDPRFEEPHFVEERRPEPKQRMSATNVQENTQERRPRAERVKPASDGPSPSEDYVYYRMIKRGDDWSRAIKERIYAPTEEIARRARSRGDDGSVLETMTNMKGLRRSQIERLIQTANENEKGDRRWEAVYIKSRRFINRTTQKVQVPEMDIILARTRPKVPVRSKSKPRKPAGEVVVEARAPSPSKSKDKDKKQKEKSKNDDDSGARPRVDSGLALLMDPIANVELFDPVTGRPRDEHGPLPFNNAGLPPSIPLEKPIGEMLEPKSSRSDRKGRRRSKSKDKAEFQPEVVAGGDPLISGIFAETTNEEQLNALIAEELKENKRGRRGSSRENEDHPAVVNPRRSRSHHRSKSRSHRGSVLFPNGYTRQYLDASTPSTSSSASETSHYGFEEYAESSNTSLSAGQQRRGSLANVHESEDATKAFREHHRGPSRRNTVHYGAPPKEYHHEGREAATVIPHRSRRDGYAPQQVKYAKYDAPMEVRYAERPTEVRYERAYNSMRPMVVRRETMPVRIPVERQLGSGGGGGGGSVGGATVVYATEPPRGTELVATRRPSDRDARPTHRYSYAEVPLAPDFPDEVVRAERADEYQRERVREEVLNMRERDLRVKERELEEKEEEMRRRRLREEERERERDRERAAWDDRRSRRGSLMRERAETRYAYRDAETGELFFYED